jgi:hypothetical protein
VLAEIVSALPKKIVRILVNKTFQKFASVKNFRNLHKQNSKDLRQQKIPSILPMKNYNRRDQTKFY